MSHTHTKKNSPSFGVGWWWLGTQLVWGSWLTLPALGTLIPPCSAPAPAPGWEGLWSSLKWWFVLQPFPARCAYVFACAVRRAWCECARGQLWELLVLL